jgi:hypothetical protein
VIIWQTTDDFSVRYIKRPGMTCEKQAVPGRFCHVRKSCFPGGKNQWAVKQNLCLIRLNNRKLSKTDAG